MNINVFNNTDVEVEDLDVVKELLVYALSKMEIKDNIEFSVIIVDNPYIKKINKEYRNKDVETDVISFALEDDNTFNGFMNTRVLGDIYISVDKVFEQSKLYNHSFKRELCFLAVHGLLHLLGYDHMDEDDAKVMFDLQDVILNGYGIKR